MKHIVTLLFFLITLCVSAQTIYVNPILTDANYEAVQDSHMVVVHENTSQNKLFLFIGGSWSNTKTYKGLAEHAADEGYDVLNLSYINNTPAAAFETDMSLDAFTNFRQELCYGTPVADLDIDSLNSIYTRATRLLVYLNSTYPTQSWDQYLLSDTELDWEKIAVGGHSQGAGHAAFLAKRHIVERVLMFAGPNDYSEYHSAPATWLTDPGLTPLSRHFSFLHAEDNVVDYSYQFSNIQGLGLYPLYDTVNVETNSPPYNNTRSLIMRRTGGLVGNHSKMIIISNANRTVWSYMLSSEVLTNLNENTSKKLIQVYPNPGSSTININLTDDLISTNYVIQDTDGRSVLSGITSSTGHQSIDISTLKKGVYSLKITDYVARIVKN